MYVNTRARDFTGEFRNKELNEIAINIKRLYNFL